MTTHNFFSYFLLVAFSFATALVFTSCNRDVERPPIGIGEPTATTDPGVEIDGIIWATRNVDMPGTFAATPESFGMFYQWNRRVGWSTTNPMVNSDGGTTWDYSTPTGASWRAENCPCPPGWRVPTIAELQSLNNFGSSDFWITSSTFVEDWNGTGVNGRLYGIYPYQIFLPAADARFSNYLMGDYLNSDDRPYYRPIPRRSRGFYWSREMHNRQSAFFLLFCNYFSRPSPINRVGGFSVRCVAE